MLSSKILIELFIPNHTFVVLKRVIEVHHSLKGERAVYIEVKASDMKR